MITREQQVEQSVQDFVRAKLDEHGYTGVTEVRDAFPSPDERARPFVTNVIALGFNFDDGGRFVELGSDLTQRVYTIEFWVFGTDMSSGSNIATAIRTFVEDESYLIPLKDIAVDGAVVEQLQVRDASYAGQGPRVMRQIPSDPRPGDRYVFTLSLRVEDTYAPSEVN